LRRFLDLDVAGQRGHDRLHLALGLHLLDDLDHQLGEDHRGRHDRVPVAENERVDAIVLEPELDGVLVGLRRLASGDVDRIAGRAEGRDELLERLVRSGGIVISDRPLSTTESTGARLIRRRP
jgi:hypothetical protein